MGKIRKYPDKTGHFGKFGGQFAPETLMHALEELNSFYMHIKETESLHFWIHLETLKAQVIKLFSQ